MVSLGFLGCCYEICGFKGVLNDCWGCSGFLSGCCSVVAKVL